MQSFCHICLYCLIIKINLSPGFCASGILSIQPARMQQETPESDGAKLVQPPGKLWSACVFFGSYVHIYQLWKNSSLVCIISLSLFLQCCLTLLLPCKTIDETLAYIFLCFTSYRFAVLYGKLLPGACTEV